MHGWEIDELISDGSGDNRWMFEEIEEQKCTHAIIRDPETWDRYYHY